MPGGRPKGRRSRTSTYHNGSKLFCSRGHAVIGDNASRRFSRTRSGEKLYSVTCVICRRANWRNYHAQGSATIARMMNKERDSRPQLTAMDIAKRRAR